MTYRFTSPRACEARRLHLPASVTSTSGTRSANAGYASAYYYQVIPQLASAIPAAMFGNHLFWFQLSNWLAARARAGRRVQGHARPAADASLRRGKRSWPAGLPLRSDERRVAWWWDPGNAARTAFHVGLYTQTWASSRVCRSRSATGARWISQKKRSALSDCVGGFAFLCHPFAGVSLGLRRDRPVQARGDVAAAAVADDGRADRDSFPSAFRRSLPWWSRR